jgi:predicted ATPase
VRATVEWSYRLLSEKERVLARRASVFVGGWRLEALEAVCAGDPVDASEVLDLVGQLVEKSIVLATPKLGAMRYGLLEPVRQYAHERLAESGQLAAVEKEHAHYYRKLAEQSRDGLRLMSDREWAEQFEIEHDNFRSVLSRLTSDETADGCDAAIALAESLWAFWWVRGYWSEGWRWLRPLVTSQPGVAPTAVFVKARAKAALLAFNLGERETGGALAARALDDGEGLQTMPRWRWR